MNDAQQVIEPPTTSGISNAILPPKSVTCSSSTPKASTTVSMDSWMPHEASVREAKEYAEKLAEGGIFDAIDDISRRIQRRNS